MLLFLLQICYAFKVTSYLKIKTVFFFLAPLRKLEMRPILTQVSTNIGKYYDEVGPMLPETIEILNEFYKPFVLRLHELLKEDRFLWKDILVT